MTNSRDLAQIVLNKLGGWRQPCRPTCATHASCKQERKVQDVITAAREILAEGSPLHCAGCTGLMGAHAPDCASRIPRQNPGLCGTKHPWIKSTWQYGGKGEPLCSECSHIEGGDCHHPLYEGMTVACVWCGTIEKGKHGSKCPIEAEVNDAYDNGPHYCGDCRIYGCVRCLRCRDRQKYCEPCKPKDVDVKREAPRYWEDKVVEELRNRLPPGYTAEPVRSAPLRDQDAYVQIYDGQKNSTGRVTQVHWRDFDGTRERYWENQHALVRLAWKRFLDRGI